VNRCLPLSLICGQDELCFKLRRFFKTPMLPTLGGGLNSNSWTVGVGCSACGHGGVTWGSFGRSCLGAGCRPVPVPARFQALSLFIAIIQSRGGEHKTPKPKTRPKPAKQKQAQAQARSINPNKYSCNNELHHPGSATNRIRE
jgi:hypothetical protein